MHPSRSSPIGRGSVDDSRIANTPVEGHGRHPLYPYIYWGTPLAVHLLARPERRDANTTRNERSASRGTRSKQGLPLWKPVRREYVHKGNKHRGKGRS